MKKTICNVATGKYWSPVIDEVAGYETPVAGLVVHKEIARNGNALELYDNSWNITHQRSGLALGQAFKRRKDALAFAEKIAGMLPYGVNWTHSRMQIRLSMTEKKRYRHLAKRQAIAREYNQW